MVRSCFITGKEDPNTAEQYIATTRDVLNDTVVVDIDPRAAEVTVGYLRRHGVLVVFQGLDAGVPFAKKEEWMRAIESGWDFTMVQGQKGRLRPEGANMISYLAVNHVLRDWLIDTVQREEKAVVGGKPCKVLYKQWATPAEQAKAREDLQAQRFWIRVLRVPFLAMPFLEAAVKKEYGQVQKAYPPERNQATPRLVNRRFDLHPRAKSKVTKYLKFCSPQGWHNVEVVTQDSPWCHDCRWYGHKSGEQSCPKKGAGMGSVKPSGNAGAPSASGIGMGSGGLPVSAGIPSSSGQVQNKLPGSNASTSMGVSALSATMSTATVSVSLAAGSSGTGPLMGLMSVDPANATVVTTVGTANLIAQGLTVEPGQTVMQQQATPGPEIRMTQQKESASSTKKKILSGGPKTIGHKPYQRHGGVRKSDDRVVTWADMVDGDDELGDGELQPHVQEQNEQIVQRAEVFQGSIKEAIAAGQPWVVVPLVFLAVEGDLQLMTAFSAEGALSIPHFEMHMEPTVETVLAEVQKWLASAYRVRPYPAMEWVRLTPTNAQGRTDILCFPIIDAIVNPAAKGVAPLTGLRWISLQLFMNPGGQTAIDTRVYDCWNAALLTQVDSHIPWHKSIFSNHFLMLKCADWTDM
ncbi:hypothetical protein CBR_g30257 [Chara braunii]|uniref:Uncharacterized protein n=1 Tax=Chara braunii TaxID=69332 RepID=A0A388LCI3_CHABU|nr:hypothetical protein CBR_g30257 [Chara braunii]|eukprot:GBG79996.1 hypothetical protein CBR_g30257 [Chara braunii]